MQNVLNFDNWIIVGQACWKMAGFFWPVILAGAILMFIEWRKEVSA